MIIIIIVILMVLVSLICALKVAGECSQEEEYRLLDPKVLDDENKDWNIEEMFTYDDEFVKKGKRCRKSNTK